MLLISAAGVVSQPHVEGEPDTTGDLAGQGQFRVCQSRTYQADFLLYLLALITVASGGGTACTVSVSKAAAITNVDISHPNTV